MMTLQVFAETEANVDVDVPQEEEIAIETYLEAPEVTITNKISSGKPQLNWVSVEGADQYEIYRSLSSNGTYEKLFTTRKTVFTNTSATSGVKYYYRIKAISDEPQIGASDYSKTVSRVCDLPRPVVKATNRASDGKIYLKWEQLLNL